MGSKNELILMVLSLVCVTIIPLAAVTALQPAIAQQEETPLGEEEENLAGDILSDVLGGGSRDNDDNDEGNDDGGAAGDDANRQIAAPVTEQDQRAANLALNEALDVTVVDPRPPRPTTTPPDDGGQEPPECSLEITTDKETYGPEDVVSITITNTGDVPIEFPDSLLGLEIKNVDTEELLLLDALPAVTTLEPGESKTFQFTYERLVDEIGTGLISATVESECSGVKEVTFTLSAPPPPEEEEITTQYETGFIECNSNDGTPQRCDNPFRVTIETTSVLKVGVTVSPLHCSSTNFYVSVDGDEDTFGGTFIGRAGYPAIFGGDDNLTIPLHDFGTVESGSHTLDIWVEGIVSGCNPGFLGRWAATLTVVTSEPAEEDTTPLVLTVP